MVTSLNNNPAYQDNLYENEQIILASIDFNSGTTTNIGGLPAGTVVTGVQVVTATGFNGTTPTINIGISNVAGTVTPAYFVSAASVATPGNASATLAATAIPLAANSTITVTRSETGSSAGLAKIVVRFAGP